MLNNSVIITIQLNTLSKNFQTLAKKLTWKKTITKKIEEDGKSINYSLYIYNGKFTSNVCILLEEIVNNYKIDNYKIMLFDKKTCCYYYYGKMKNIFLPLIDSTNSISFTVSYTK